MLENNPMGSRRRRRFYHRAGVVPIPGENPKEYFEVPTSFFSDDPESEEESHGGKPRTSIVSISTLLYRLLDIVNKMIEMAEAEDREKEKEQAKQDAPINQDQDIADDQDILDEEELPIDEDLTES